MRNLTHEELALIVVSGAGECGSGSKANNGWGNGEDPAPGNSLEAQPKFEDPNTGLTPSSSPCSADFDR